LVWASGTKNWRRDFSFIQTGFSDCATFLQTNHWWTPYVSAYLLLDTMIYLNYLIFCADFNNSPKRLGLQLTPVFIAYTQSKKVYAEN